MNSLMSRLRAFAVRFRSSFRASNAEPDLEAEMTAHFEMQTADNVAAGMSQEEARRQALIKFGGLEQSKEQVRERRTLPFLETCDAERPVCAERVAAKPGICCDGSDDSGPWHRREYGRIQYRGRGAAATPSVPQCFATGLGG